MKLWNEIDALVEAQCRPDGPGCALGVFKHGKAIYLKGYGSKRAGERDPVGSRTVFNLASVSKQFTAFCVLLLHERGKLSLDDRLRRHMPEFGPRFEAVRIRHLMHHSSGMPSIPDLRWSDIMAGTWEGGGEAHVRMLARQAALNFEPGETYCYSNDGYFLLAEIVRRCSGQSLARFADLNIFKPLGMAGTRFVESVDLWISERAQGHRLVKGAQAAVAKTSHCPGDTDLWSCIEDLGRWERSQCEQSLGGADLYRRQTAPGKLRRENPMEGGYAAGLGVTRFLGSPMLCHDGGEIGFTSTLVRLPRQGLALAMLWNREDKPEKVAGLILRKLLNKPAPKPAPKPRRLPQEFRSAAGVYDGQDHPGRLELKAKPRGLSLWAAEYSLLLQHRSGALFWAPIGNGHWTYRLARARGGPWILTQIHEGKTVQKLRWAGKVSAKIPDLAVLVGRYLHRESGYRFELKRKGARLMYVDPHPEWNPGGALKWQAPDRIVTGGGSYAEIERDRAGKVRALMVCQPEGRNKQIRCVKLS